MLSGCGILAGEIHFNINERVLDISLEDLLMLNREVGFFCFVLFFTLSSLSRKETSELLLKEVYLTLGKKDRNIFYIQI